jgi:hypothetical protein
VRVRPRMSESVSGTVSESEWVNLFFILDLFSDAFNCPEYVVSNDRVVIE